MRALLLTATSALAAMACGGALPTPPAGPPEVASPYDEAADPAHDTDAALAAARADGKLVLLVLGGNWCPWCRRLEHTFRFDSDVAAALASGFHVVHVDTGARKSGKNADVNERYGNPMQYGLPVLVVLAADGSVRKVQETGALEEGDHHSPARILAFLAAVRGGP